jgi:hypothetical protein
MKSRRRISIEKHQFVNARSGQSKSANKRTFSTDPLTAQETKPDVKFVLKVKINK